MSEDHWSKRDKEKYSIQQKLGWLQVTLTGSSVRALMQKKLLF